MENNYHLELDIDSDILRALTYFDLLSEEYGFIEREFVKGKDAALYNHFGYLVKLFNLAKDGKIYMVINDAIFQENKHSQKVLKFMQKYCYFPNITPTNAHRRADEARRLAYAYCKPYTAADGKIHNAPMKFVYFADISKYAPTNDTYAAAQATRDGRCLLTANGQDLIFNKRGNRANHDRSRGIVEINMLLNYYTEKEDGIILVPRPLHIQTFGALLNRPLEEILLSSSYEKLIKADTILTNEEIESLVTNSFIDSSL